MVKVLYHDNIEPQEFEKKFDTTDKACEWIAITMQDLWDTLFERYPMDDIVWLNRYLDVGDTTEIYVVDSNIEVVCTLIEY